jgi:hypothetical protein
MPAGRMRESAVAVNNILHSVARIDVRSHCCMRSVTFSRQPMQSADMIIIAKFVVLPVAVIFASQQNVLCLMKQLLERSIVCQWTDGGLL